MTTIETQAVLAANSAFYRAMREGDYAAMDMLWTRRRRVSCTHPDGPPIQGRRGVMASWRKLLLPRRCMPIRIRDPKAIVMGASALVLCVEELGRVRMMASNCFVREAEGWHMLSHSAAEIRTG